MSKLSLSALTLRNFRCFEHVSIDFHPQLTVLVAPNGNGKTALLDAIAVAFGPYVGAFDEAVGKHFAPDDIRLQRVRETASNEMEYAIGGVWLEARGYIPGSLVEMIGEDGDLASWRRALASPTKAKTTVKDAGELVSYGVRMQDAARTPASGYVLPVLAYYGTGRLWQPRRLTRSKLERTSRTIGYADCLDPGSSYKAFADWFRYWSTNALQVELKAAETRQPPRTREFADYIESVRRPINECLDPAGWKDVNFSHAREELVASHEDHGQLPVSLLSDGIRNMIGMVADIAFRATKLNPHLGARASLETGGIVLIDEVDMHLHPAWQQSVLSGLNRAFPNLQFIVTTHSPQVVSTVPAECIRVLADGKVFAAPAGTEGAEASRVLKRVFGVEPRPPGNEVTHKLREYLDLVDADQGQSERAKALRAELDGHYRGEEPALFDADLQMENRQWERDQ